MAIGQVVSVSAIYLISYTERSQVMALCTEIWQYLYTHRLRRLELYTGQKNKDDYKSASVQSFELQRLYMQMEHLASHEKYSSITSLFISDEHIVVAILRYYLIGVPPTCNISLSASLCLCMACLCVSWTKKWQLVINIA